MNFQEEQFIDGVPIIDQHRAAFQVFRATKVFRRAAKHF